MRRLRWLLAIFMASAMIAAACGDDSTTTAEPDTAEPAPAEPDTAEPAPAEPAPAEPADDAEPAPAEPADEPPMEPLEPITIGVVIPLSGPVAGYGTAQEEALKIFEATQNKAETSPFGYPLRFRIVNDNSDGTQSAGAVRELIADDEVLGIICCSSTAMMLATYDIVAGSEVPVYFHTPNEYPNYNMTDYVYQVGAGTQTDQASLIRDFAASMGIGMDDVGVAFNNDASGELSAKLTRELGFTKVHNFPGDLTDYGPLISEWQADDVKMIFTESNMGSSIHIRRAQVAAGFGVPIIMGQSSVNSSLFETLGDDLETVYLVTFPPLVSDTTTISPPELAEAVTLMVDAFAAEGGNAGNLGLGGVAWSSALSYAAAAQAAYEAGDLTRSGINDVMETQSFISMFGPIQRTPTEHRGLVGAGVVISQYTDGQSIPIPEF